jgi:K+-transporting ATPase ATPase C chain
MKALLRPALTLFLLLNLLTGVLYPLLVTGIATLFPQQRLGSLLERDGKIVGSDLIGQSFSSPGYFWGRPSATGPYPYNAAASAGSNWGPLNPALISAVADRRAALQAADPGQTAPPPIDLVTASASGLDPHLSPAAAFYQINRVARARGLDPAQVRALVEQQIESRQFGLFGEPRVNVLRLNLALGRLR